MGASSSSNGGIRGEEEEEEQLVASSGGSVAVLRSAFSTLSSSSSSSELSYLFQLPPSSLSSNNCCPSQFPSLISNLGPSIASLLFPGSSTSSSSITWLDFLKGYNTCCARMQASSSLNLLFRLYSHACSLSGVPCGLEFDPDSDKVGGFLTPSDLMMIFSMCWLMERSWRVKGCEEENEVVMVVLLDLTHLVLSALQVEGDGDLEKEFWEGDALGSQRKVMTHAVSAWMVRDVPGIGEGGEMGGEEGEEGRRRERRRTVTGWWRRVARPEELEEEEEEVEKGI